MSVKTKTYTEHVARSGRVMVCDNCGKESPLYDPRTHPVPPGWIVVSETVSPDLAVAPAQQHYCGRVCHTDAVSL